MRCVLLIVALAFTARLGWAGAPIKAFEPGKPPPPEVLKNVAVKAVVAEFLDPDNTHLGKEVGYVLWRELLTAVSDQHGAGVIFAHAPGTQRLVDMLQAKYHEAAIEIAKSQNARMAIWGALTEADELISIDTYLSLVGDISENELTVKMVADDYHHANATGYEARISRTRFNFPRVQLTRQQLFERPLYVLADTDMHETAGPGKVLRRVHVNETLQTDGMEGEWFKVQLAGGGHGYLNSVNVFLPPREIDTNAGGANWSTQPDMKHQIADSLPGNARATVLESRYVANSGLWYHIKTSARDGWVAAYSVRARFSLPITTFAAGLFRYQLGRYNLAAGEFGGYTQLDGVNADPASLSTAYQLLSASLLVDQTGYKQTAISALSSAIQVTPFDAGAYSLRAVAILAQREFYLAQVLADLRKALELDPERPDARNTVALLLGISPKRANPIAQEGMPFKMTDRDVQNLRELGEKYAISAK